MTGFSHTRTSLTAAFSAAKPLVPMAIPIGEVVFNTGHDRLSGNPHRSFLCPADRHPDLPAYRQHRHHAGRRRINRVWAAGLIIRDPPLISSNWRDKQPGSVPEGNGTVAIAGIDTRRKS